MKTLADLNAHLEATGGVTRPKPGISLNAPAPRKPVITCEDCGKPTREHTVHITAGPICPVGIPTVVLHALRLANEAAGWMVDGGNPQQINWEAVSRATTDARAHIAKMPAA